MNCHHRMETCFPSDDESCMIRRVFSSDGGTCFQCSGVELLLFCEGSKSPSCKTYCLCEGSLLRLRSEFLSLVVGLPLLLIQKIKERMWYATAVKHQCTEPFLSLPRPNLRVQDSKGSLNVLFLTFYLVSSALMAYY